MIEREIKYIVDDFAPYRVRLARINAAHVSSFFEDNIIFDNEEETLRKEGKLLRLRKSDTVTITFKEPVDRTRFKIVEEHEIDVSDFDAAEKIITSLGFHKVFRYQKNREIYTLKGAHILLDETPIGNYIEIEGEEDLIVQLSEQLGFSPNRGTSKNYMELYREYCEQNNLEPSDMVF
jgi:adenylate cyclase class 2